MHNKYKYGLPDMPWLDSDRCLSGCDMVGTFAQGRSQAPDRRGVYSSSSTRNTRSFAAAPAAEALGNHVSTPN
jgi:hypothetical protein